MPLAVKNNYERTHALFCHTRLSNIRLRQNPTWNIQNDFCWRFFSTQAIFQNQCLAARTLPIPDYHYNILNLTNVPLYLKLLSCCFSGFSFQARQLFRSRTLTIQSNHRLWDAPFNRTILSKSPAPTTIGMHAYICSFLSSELNEALLHSLVMPRWATRFFSHDNIDWFTL
jgi:hypothetical protein